MQHAAVYSKTHISSQASSGVRKRNRYGTKFQGCASFEVCIYPTSFRFRYILLASVALRVSTLEHPRRPEVQHRWWYREIQEEERLRTWYHVSHPTGDGPPTGEIWGSVSPLHASLHMSSRPEIDSACRLGIGFHNTEKKKLSNPPNNPFVSFGFVYSTSFDGWYDHGLIYCPVLRGRIYKILTVLLSRNIIALREFINAILWARWYAGWKISPHEIIPQTPKISSISSSSPLVIFST